MILLLGWVYVVVTPFPYLIFRKHLSFKRLPWVLCYHLSVVGPMFLFAWWWYVKPDTTDAGSWREVPSHVPDVLGLFSTGGFLLVIFATLIYDSCKGRTKKELQGDILYLMLMNSSNTLLW